MGFAKGLKKMFGASSKPKGSVENAVTGGAVSSDHVATASKFNMTPLDVKKAEKAQKKALKKAGKNKGGVSTSFPSSPNSAEIRIPGKPYIPTKSPGGSLMIPPPASNVLIENRRAMNDASPLSSITSPYTKPSAESKRFFGSPPTPSAGPGRYVSDEENNPTKPLTKQHLNDFAGAMATPPQHKGYLCNTETPASSSDFCLSTDIEDEEYNRAKQYYETHTLMPEASTSMEEESTLFGGDLAGEDEIQNRRSQNHSMKDPNIITSFGAKPGAGLFPDSSDSELDGEDMLPSPVSQASENPNIRVKTEWNRNPAGSPSSPIPRHPSSKKRGKGVRDDGFGFQEFVVNAWPDQGENGQGAQGANIISFGDAFGKDPFDAAHAPGASSNRKETSRKNKSGSSVASAPLVDPKFSQTGQSSARGSRSVAPTATARHASSFRSSPSNAHTSHMLDKLERELREKHAKSGSGRSITTPNRHRREKSNTVSPNAHAPSDEERKDPDNWLINEVTDALGPRGDTADMVSLSGRSTRSKTDRSASGRSHKSKSTTRRHASGRHKSSSGASVTSRSSHYSQRSLKSHMSEASKSVANDLLRLEMQLAMVGKDTGSVADLVSAAQSVGGGSIAGGSVRSKRTHRSKSSRASPTASSGVRNRKTVVAPPGKLGLILANKPDGRGTIVSGVRPTSTLVDLISTGDRIIAVDGEDVSHMNVSELTTIMTRKSDFDRKLTVISLPQTPTGAALPNGRTGDKSVAANK